jgi:3-hydroxybutyrate dehydrogenase
MSVENKVVFITGAASGIGLEMGRSFAQKGARVVLTDIDEEKVIEAAKNISTPNVQVIGMVCDVTSEEQISIVINKTHELHGRLDVLINNAGLQYIAPIEEFPTAKFELLLKVMLVAPFIAIKHALPIMKRQQYGRIINMASINGLVGFAGKAAYNSAKHGLIGLTKVAALECAENGITVNALCPGYVDTPLVRDQLEAIASMKNIPLEKVLEEVIYPLVPQKRLLSVAEIFGYVNYLVSDEACGVTGQAVVIDGGYTAQ